MSRKDEWWIHRGALYQALGFKSGKIPLNHSERRENFQIPIGVRYEELPNRRYRYHPVRTFTGTVIIRAKTQRYREVYDMMLGKRRTVKRHDASHRVFVLCPKCKAEVPAGRLHQHVDTKICRSKQQ